MVTELQNGAADPMQSSSRQAPTQAQIDEKLIVLSAPQLKQVKEIAGLSANFQCESVKEAFVEVPAADPVKAVIEIFKNAKPADVALRYARESWVADDSVSSRLTVRTTYGATAEMESLRALVREIAQATIADQQPARINLKDSTLLVPTVCAAHEESITTDTVRKSEVEPSNMPAENATPTNQQVNNRGYQTNESTETAKYATYSRSEVDRMFKQQTEAIAATLGGKISSQSKAFQEAIDEQQRTFNKSIDKLIQQVDQFRMKLEANAVSQKSATKEQLDSFSSDLTKELEQFKASLNKSIVPSIKTVEEKLRQVSDTTTSQKTGAQNTSGTANSAMLTALVCACLTASIISIVLQVVHH
ncbi:MAG TPA: hypothetical protein V6C69_05605 [Trichormus sp.]|jgi:hypothetical protein